MGLEYMGLEENFSIPALVKTAEAWEGGFLAPAKVEEETADDIVQAIGGFRRGDTGLARHPFYDIRLLHSDSKLAMRHAGALIGTNPISRMLLALWQIQGRRNPKIEVNAT